MRHNPLSAPKTQVWGLIKFLLDEFEPWLKWLVFDAVLRIVLTFVANRSARLRVFFETLGLVDPVEA